MGKDFIPLKENGFNIEKIYNKVYTKDVLNASEEKYFYTMPDLNKVINIQVGIDGTDEIIINLKNDDFIVLDGTISLK